MKGKRRKKFREAANRATGGTFGQWVADGPTLYVRRSELASVISTLFRSGALNGPTPSRDLPEASPPEIEDDLPDAFDEPPHPECDGCGATSGLGPPLEEDGEVFLLCTTCYQMATAHLGAAEGPPPEIAP